MFANITPVIMAVLQPTQKMCNNSGVYWTELSPPSFIVQSEKRINLEDDTIPRLFSSYLFMSYDIIFQDNLLYEARLQKARYLYM